MGQFRRCSCSLCWYQFWVLLQHGALLENSCWELYIAIGAARRHASTLDSGLCMASVGSYLQPNKPINCTHQIRPCPTFHHNLTWADKRPWLPAIHLWLGIFYALFLFVQSKASPCSFCDEKPKPVDGLTGGEDNPEWLPWTDLCEKASSSKANRQTCIKQRMCLTGIYSRMYPHQLFTVKNIRHLGHDWYN